jgi:hypothetical protein
LSGFIDNKGFFEFPHFAGTFMALIFCLLKLEEKLALADDRLNVGSYALSH